MESLKRIYWSRARGPQGEKCLDFSKRSLVSMSLFKTPATPLQHKIAKEPFLGEQLKTKTRRNINSPWKGI